MSTVIGLAVSEGHLRAVLLRGGRILWAVEVDLEGGTALDHAITELFSRAPLPRWRRPAVVAAIGPAASQVKRVAGLPLLTDPGALEQIVQEGAERFFLSRVPLLTTGVRMIGPGVVWVGAFERALVQQVEEGCRRARVRLKAVLPTAAVLPFAFQGERIVWRDGEALCEITLEARQLARVQRSQVQPSTSGDEPMSPVPALAAMGERGARFGDAYGAAVTPFGGALVLSPGRNERGSGRSPRWRLAAAWGVLASATTFALATPGALAYRLEGEAERRLAAISAERAEAINVDRELRRLSAALAEAAAFDSARYSTTLLLAELSRALPEQSALTAVRIDSSAGTIVLLAPSVASVLSALEKSPGVTLPAIVGPVTREKLAGRELERATVRFRISVRERGRDSQPPAGGQPK